MVMREPLGAAGLPNGLLMQCDPAPVRQSGDLLDKSPFLLLGDHAGRGIPASLDGLGLDTAALERHIALDIGVEELGLAMGKQLGAPFLRQVYSRLVIDCNRNPDRPDAVPQVSDGTLIPGNAALTEPAHQARVAAIFDPYHQAIHAALDVRKAAGLNTILIALHSFTPVMDGHVRRCQIGILHGAGKADFALALSTRLRGQARFMVADNEPYAMDDTDYTVPTHAFTRALRYAEVEVRQDLIGPGSEPGVKCMADLLTEALTDCAGG